MSKRTASPVRPTSRVSPRTGPSFRAAFEVSGRGAAGLSSPKTVSIFIAIVILTLAGSGTAWAQDAATGRPSLDVRRRYQAGDRALQAIEASQKAAFQALTGNVVAAAARRAVVHTTVPNMRR